jgi:hypothetical protein
MPEANTPFDPNQVAINYTMNSAQVALILRGLGKLPLEEVEQLFNGMRNVAIQTLQKAEQEAIEAGGNESTGPTPE